MVIDLKEGEEFKAVLLKGDTVHCYHVDGTSGEYKSPQDGEVAITGPCAFKIDRAVNSPPEGIEQ